MLQELLTSAGAMEKEAVRAEASAQKAYEVFSKDSTESMATKETQMAGKKSQKAKLEKVLVQTKRSREGQETSLEQLTVKLGKLHDAWTTKHS